jgi:hypothetical protein
MFYTHVDDFIHFAPRGQGEEDILQVCKRFPSKFFGEAKHVLGMSIERDRGAKTISILQPHLVEGALARISQEGSVPCACLLTQGVKLSSDAQLPPLHDGQVAEYPAIVGTCSILRKMKHAVSADEQVTLKCVVPFMYGQQSCCPYICPSSATPLSMAHSLRRLAFHLRSSVTTADTTITQRRTVASTAVTRQMAI